MAEGEFPGGFTLTGSIRESIRQGLSGRAALERFRFPEGRGAPQQGFIANKAFREAFNLERQNIAQGPRLADLDTGIVPDSGMFTPWKAGAAGRKFAQIKMQVFDSGIGGLVDQHWLVPMTDDMTIQDAIDRAADQYAFGQDDDGSPYAQGRITLAQLSSLRVTI